MSFRATSDADFLVEYPKSLSKYFASREESNGGPKLCELEIALANYVLSKRPIKEEDDAFEGKTIVAHKCVFITGKILRSARPGKWIYDDIIDAVGIALTQLQWRVDGVLHNWYLPTWFQGRVNQGADLVSVWSDMWFWIDNTLERCHRIYIPLNDRNMHWYLLILSAPEQEMYYVDTLPSTEARKETCIKMRDFLQDAIDSCMSISNVSSWHATRLKNWKFVYDIPGIPKQLEMNDGDNCGLYVIHFMTHANEVPVVRKGMVLTAKHRFRLIASLILWTGNEEKDHILRECESFCQKYKLSQCSCFQDGAELHNEL